MSDKPKLAKLPPLPRAKKRGGPGNRPPNLTGERGRKRRSDLPPLPDELDEAPPRDPDETGRAQDGWGGDEEGRWFETGKEHGQVGGRCWKCGRLRKAENLSLWMRPFGQGEVWICKGGC